MDVTTVDRHFTDLHLASGIRHEVGSKRKALGTYRDHLVVKARARGPEEMRLKDRTRQGLGQCKAESVARQLEIQHTESGGDYKSQPG